MVQTRDGAAGLWTQRDGAARAGLSGLHAAARRQLRAELLDRTARPTGREFSWTRWPFPSCWPGGCGRPKAWATSMSFRLSSGRRAFWCAMRPVTQQERWEENAGYSPSTLAAVIAGLICASGHGARTMARGAVGPVSSKTSPTGLNRIWRSGQSTNDGVLLPDVKRHYMRIRPPQCGDPIPQADCPAATFCISPTAAPAKDTSSRPARSSTPAFWSWCATASAAPTIQLIVDSLKVVDARAEDRDALRPLLAALQPRRLRPAQGWRPL